MDTKKAPAKRRITAADAAGNKETGQRPEKGCALPGKALSASLFPDTHK
jgi:hypothetical protein